MHNVTFWGCGMDWILDSFSQLGITTLPLICTLYKSVTRSKSSQSSPCGARYGSHNSVYSSASVQPSTTHESQLSTAYNI
jgi:hypothetical protein